ncbi:MAG: hypothetical protein M0Q41_12060 [Bacteroidales bacterium]|nr:hypothetical protein [Bacteroidales bacterium]
MSAFDLFVFHCPQCKSEIVWRRLKNDAISYTELYSDGKMICDGVVATDHQLVICPSCAHPFWLTNSINLLPPEQIQDMELTYPFQSWYMFGADLQKTEGILALIGRLTNLLAVMKPYTNEQEIYLRKLLLWTYNDLVRNHHLRAAFHLLHPFAYVQEIINHRQRLKQFRKRHTNYVANIIRLIELLRIQEDKAATRTFIAELYREKGNHARCLELLEAVSWSTYFTSEIKEKATAKCALVFKVAG